MNKDFKKYLVSYYRNQKNLIKEAPSASSTLLGGKSVKIPRDGAHAGQSGWQSSEAWDIKADIGDPVYALADGTVITMSDYGSKVIKKDGKKLFGAGFTVQGSGGAPDIYYTHLMSVQVKKGETVKCGQLLGFVMDFPGSSYDHVHIGVKPPANIRDLIDSNGNIKCSAGKSFKGIKDIKLSDLEKEIEKELGNKNVDTSKIFGGLDLSKLGSGLLGGDLFKSFPFLAAIAGSAMKESKQVDKEIEGIKNIFENMDETASSLRQVAIGKYGWSEKSGQLSDGGEIKSDVSNIVNELISEFDKVRPDCKGKFTAGNDKFHHNIKSYTSRHTKGEAVDLTLPSGCHQDFMKLMNTFKSKYNGFNYIDEYRNPTSKATGGHFHLSYRPGQPEGGKKSSETVTKPEDKTSEIEDLLKDKDFAGIKNLLSKDSTEKKGDTKVDLDMFKGLPIFDLLSKMLGGMNESKKITNQKEEIYKIFEELEKISEKTKIRNILNESIIDDLGADTRVDGKSIRIKIGRKTNIFSPVSGEIKTSFTPSSCTNKVGIRFDKDGSRYFLEYCGLNSVSVSDGDLVSKSKIIGDATDDVTVSLYNKNLTKLNFAKFFQDESTKSEEKKKKKDFEDDKEENFFKKPTRYADPLMAAVRAAPFAWLGKMKSPTEKEGPPKGLYQYLDKNSPTKQKKVNENIDRIKKLLK